MKQALLFIFISAALVFNAQHPFKYDSLYPTIFAKQFCELLQKDPNVQLIDVRSPGEHNDTSRFASLNIGHLKGAINIQNDSILKHIELLAPYKNKTIVFYCSHSQRSRGVSKFAKENGFTNFYNLNGGLTTLNQLNTNDFPCKEALLLSNNLFKNLSFEQTAKLIDAEKKLVIVDVRTPQEFNSKDTLPQNNIGRLKNALNIPYEKEKTNLDALSGSKDLPVLVYAASGDGNGARMAKMLREQGFKTVYHLFGGLNSFNSKQVNRKYFDAPLPFTVIEYKAALNLLKTKKDLLIYDTRSEQEYMSKMPPEAGWKNQGRMKNAVNVNVNDYSGSILPKDFKTPLMIYGGKNAYVFAASLAQKGYKNISVLYSFYDFVWSSFNIDGCKENLNYVAGREGLY
jgi:rhodanese-related sulfurtransferase